MKRLACLGSRYVHFGLKEVEVEKVEIKGLDDLKEELEEAKKVLSACLSEDDETKGRVYEALQTLSYPVYVKIALEEVLKDEAGAKKLEEITEDIYKWFYYEFEPARLILHNDIRRDVAERYVEEFKDLFPWWTLYADVDPDIFDYIAAELASFGRVSRENEKFLFVAMNDDPLKKFLEAKITEYLSFKNAVIKAFDENPALVVATLAGEVAERKEFWLDEKAAAYYPAAASRAYKKLKELVGPEEALLTAVIAGPVSDTYEWLKALHSNPVFRKEIEGMVKEYLDTGSCKSIEERFKMWVAAVEEEAKHMEIPLEELEEKEELLYERFEDELRRVS